MLRGGKLLLPPGTPVALEENLTITYGGYPALYGVLTSFEDFESGATLPSAWAGFDAKSFETPYVCPVAPEAARAWPVAASAVWWQCAGGLGHRGRAARARCCLPRASSPVRPAGIGCPAIAHASRLRSAACMPHASTDH